MFADEHDSVHGELVSAQRECFADGWIDAEAVLRRQRSAHIVIRHLIGIHRDDIDLRLPQFAVVFITTD